MGYPKYSGLSELLRHDGDALRYFEALPMAVRDRLAPKGRRIDSFEALRNYADALSDQED